MDNLSLPPIKRRKTKGFLNPKVVRAVTFYIISACIIFSVAVCILAIWNYAKTDVFWRMIATLGVIAIGSAVFAFVNGIFGTEEE
jgi:nucleoside recognition membrane protein YjiH